MTDWIRVRDTSGHEISVRGDVPDGHPRGQRPGMRKLDKPATRGGAPLPPKMRTPLGSPLPGSKTDQRRTRKKKTTAAKPATAKAAPQPATETGHEAATEEE